MGDNDTTVTTTNDNGDSAPSAVVPMSIICFLKGTMVKTDQGLVAIDKLKPGQHTIDDLELLCVTKTKTKEDNLILIKKNTFGENVPSKDLVISNKHCILFQNYWIEAECFLAVPGVEKIKYNNELLYNIVLERRHQVDVYNLTCDTLSPHCKVAQYFLHKKNKATK